MAQPFLDLNLIVKRIQIQVTDIKKVAEAMDIAAAEQDMKNIAAAAYVLPLPDRPGSNSLANGVHQDVTTGFGILLAVKNLTDMRGAKARSKLTALRSDVCDAFLNWTPGPYDEGTETFTPDANYTPCEFAGGRLMKLNDTVLWWLDEYRTSFAVRAT